MSNRPTGRDKGVFYSQTRRQGIPDPYIPRKGHKEPTICPSCKAVYQKKHWTLDEDIYFDIKKQKKATFQKCPACRKIEDGYAMGIINMSGSFIFTHLDEIISLIRSEERRAIEKNPLERLMGINKKGKTVVVKTTADSLALRIGKVLSKSYKGNSKIDWKYGDKFVIVEWNREI